MAKRWCAFCRKFKNNVGICDTIKHLSTCSDYLERIQIMTTPYPPRFSAAAAGYIGDAAQYAGEDRRHGSVGGAINAGQQQLNPQLAMRKQQYDTARSRILNEAMEITHKDRNSNYGNPEDNFQHIANLWNDYLRVRRPQAAVLDSRDVAVMNMLIKVARLGNNPQHRDSVVDIAGYAACLGDAQEASVGKAQHSQIVGNPDAAMQAYARNHESGTGPA